MSHFLCGMRGYVRLILCTLLLLLPAVPVTAQTQYSEWDDEIVWEEERPTACPTALTPSFNWNPTGYPRTFQSVTYWFTNPWIMRQDQQGRGYTTADYYASSGFSTYPPDVVDDSGTLLWRRAGHRQECTMRIIRRRSGRTAENLRFKQVAVYGSLERVTVACSDGGGGGATEFQPASDYGYDPYEAGAGDEDCSGGGIGGGGGDSTGGGTCGGNQNVVFDYICIDIYVEGTGWVEVWCGVAAICG